MCVCVCGFVLKFSKQSCVILRSGFLFLSLPTRWPSEGRV